MQTWSSAIFKSHQFVFCLKKNDTIGDVTDEEVNLAKQINLEVDSDNVQKLMDSHKQELTIDELIEMHEQEDDIEELESLIRPSLIEKEF
ncbi:hypothetical protein TNCV_4189751 [Trichonephila clavipes]|nr:hypothetical protein TNCV_4189751 [Trichonephila clavipes]